VLLEHLEFLRPTTFDLTTRLLAVGHIKIQKVAVTSLREKAYIGTIWVSANDEIHEVDARPSDGIALALQAGAPIFVDPEVFRSADLLSPEHELEQL
jgi:bifunctional DNase/RNase